MGESGEKGRQVGNMRRKGRRADGRCGKCTRGKGEARKESKEEKKKRGWKGRYKKRVKRGMKKEGSGE